MTWILWEGSKVAEIFVGTEVEAWSRAWPNMWRMTGPYTLRTA